MVSSNQKRYTHLILERNMYIHATLAYINLMWAEKTIKRLWPYFCTPKKKKCPQRDHKLKKKNQLESLYILFRTLFNLHDAQRVRSFSVQMRNLQALKKLKLNVVGNPTSWSWGK